MSRRLSYADHRRVLVRRQSHLAERIQAFSERNTARRWLVQELKATSYAIAVLDAVRDEGLLHELEARSVTYSDLV